MAFSSKQENDYESQLKQIAGEVDSYIVKTDGALEYFREQIGPLAQRWKTYHEAVDKRKKELLDYWEKVKNNSKLQDKNMKPSEELEWDRFYLSGLDSFGSNPINEMPAKYAPDVMASLEKYLERNEKNEKGYPENSSEYKRLQETIAKQRQDLEDIRSEFDKLSSAEKKSVWIKTPPKTVIPNKIYYKFTWWRYLNLSDEVVFGCWRPPLIPLPEYPLNILKPVGPGYQRNQTRKELPDARNTQEEYERYYIFLSSVHDNYLQGIEKITEGIWSDDLSRQVLCCLDEGHGDKTAFLKAALERVCQSKHQPQKHQNFFRQLVIAILVSLLIVAIFEVTLHCFEWSWLLNHKNAIALEVGFDLLIVCVVFGVFVSRWRKKCFISAVVSLFLMLIPLLGGYNKAAVKQLETPKIEDETTTEIKTSGASSPAIITSEPNSSVSVLYKDGNVQISKNIEALNELVVQGRKIRQVYPGSPFSCDDTDFQKWKHTCLVFLKMTVPNVYQDFLEATKLSNKPEDFPQFEIPRAIEKGIAVLEGCKLSLVNILRHDN